MSKRIKPNAEHRIVDGEVVSGSIDDKIQRGKEYSAEKAQQHQFDDEPVENAEAFEGVDPKAPISDGIEEVLQQQEQGFLQRYKSYILWALLFIVVIAVLFITRPDTDWQVQRINDLQSDVAQIRQENSALEARLVEQEDKLKIQIENALSSAQNQPVISQADLTAMESKMQQELIALQTKMAALTGQAGEQVEKALQQLNQLGQKSQNLQPSSQQLEALNKLEGQLQAKLTKVTEKLNELFEFKAEQQVLTKQPPVLKLDMPLDSLQIQQWIVEINTQWILNGRIAETRQQLLALEQAVSLSDFVYTTQLARLIGQDLGYLKQLSQDQVINPIPTTDALKLAVQKLSADRIENSGEMEKSTVSQDPNASGLDNLLNRFSQVITLKKRSEGDALTEVDSLLINDVLQQRLSLLVDRLDWGLQTHSATTVTKAADDIRQFVKRHYANDFAEFNGLLARFANIQFANKVALSIMNLDESINE